MSEYTPDTWVVIKINAPDSNETYYKVLGGWSGGYADGDSWRMNSGIAMVEDVEDCFMFHGYSGSVYKCWKGTYRLTMATSGIWAQLKENYGDRVEIMDEDTDWTKVEYPQ